jgi:hypothetical protein
VAVAVDGAKLSLTDQMVMVSVVLAVTVVASGPEVAAAGMWVAKKMAIRQLDTVVDLAVAGLGLVQ